MELLFLTISVKYEVIILLLLGVVILAILGHHVYDFTKRLIQIFGPNKRDAILSKRDKGLLQKREEERNETPKPIVLDELESIEAIDIDTVVESSKEKENFPDDADDLIESELPSSHETIEIPAEVIPEESHEVPEETEIPHEEIPENSPDQTEETSEKEIVDTEVIEPEEITLDTDNNEKTEDTPITDMQTESDKPEDSEETVVQEEETPEEKPKKKKIVKSYTEAESPTDTKSKPEKEPEHKKENHVETLYEKVNAAKTLFARGRIDEARTIIIE